MMGTDHILMGVTEFIPVSQKTYEEISESLGAR